ncbi:MAG: hypothetical protein JKY65_25420 [Planctomycetes bacterium]|nr:hypothetical protein [Planctomycetota bacterium]
MKLAPLYILALSGLISLGFGGVTLAQDAKPEDSTEEKKKDGTEEKKKDSTERRRGRRRGGRRGGRRGMGGFNPERMQKELGLDDAQSAKMKELMSEMRKSMRKMREEGGGWEGMREKMGDMRKKMSEVLTPEQRKKFEKMNEGRGRRGMRRGRRNSEQDFKRLRDEAVKSLELSEEESAVLVPLLDGVIETRKLLKAEGEKRRKAFLESVRSTSDEAQLAELLTRYRADRAIDKATLKKSQAKLIEVLTPTQEAKLVAFNLLD